MASRLERAVAGREREVAVFLIALVLRLAYALPRAELVWIDDAGAYLQLASNMMSGRGFVTDLEPYFRSWRPPGYPFFLVGVFTFFGQSASAIAALQSVLGALTCVWILRIGTACVGPRVGLLAAALTIVNPELLRLTPNPLTETLYVALVAWTVLLVIGVYRGAGWRTAALAGFTLGAAILVRPTLLPAVPFIALFAGFGAARDRSERVRRAVLVGAVAVAVLVPWTLRNYRIHGAFVPVATIGGVALFVGLPPSDDDIAAIGSSWPAWRLLEAGLHRLPNGYDMLPELNGVKRAPPDPPLDELEQSRAGTAYFLRYVREDPVRYARLLVTKASLAFNPLMAGCSWPMRAYGFGCYDVLVRLYAATFFTFLFAMAPLGIMREPAPRGPVLLVAGLVALHVGLQLLFRPALRYFQPGLVLATVFAAAGVLALRRLWADCVAGDVRAWRIAGVWALWLIALGTNVHHQVFDLHHAEVQCIDWALDRLLRGQCR